jgi:hypothetical protein
LRECRLIRIVLDEEDPERRLGPRLGHLVRGSRSCEVVCRNSSASSASDCEAMERFSTVRVTWIAHGDVSLFSSKLADTAFALADCETPAGAFDSARVVSP